MKKKIIIGIIIGGIIALMVGVNLNKDTRETSPMGRGKTYEVKATIIEKNNISSSIIVTGRVEENTKKDIYFDSPVKVSEVLVSKGDEVNAGDPLMHLDLSTLESELEQLQVSLDIQILQLEKIQNLDTTTDTASLDIAVELALLNVDTMQTYYDQQLESYAKNQLLLEEGIISSSELDSSLQLVNDAAGQLETAQLTLQQRQIELDSYISSNTDSVASRDLDIEIQLKNIETIEMSITSLEEQIETAEETIICPIDGVITDINISEDEFTSTMEPSMTIMNVDDLKITADIKEYNITNVTLDQPVIISGDAIVEDATITGKISYVDPIAISDPVLDTTTISVEMTILQGASFLKPGYTTDCEITTQIKENVIIGSYEMLKEDEDGSKYVFVIDENNLLVKQYIELGITSDFDVEVIEGLNEGDRVVLNPSIVLEEGSQVTIQQDSKE